MYQYVDTMNTRNGTLLNHFVFNRTDVLRVGEGAYQFYSEKKGAGEMLDSLKKINIFVGANNVGKSRVLRSMFAQDEYVDHGLHEELSKFNGDLEQVLHRYPRVSGSAGHVLKLERELSALLKGKGIDLPSKVRPFLQSAWKEIREKGDKPVSSVSGEPALMHALKDLFKKHEELVEHVTNPFERQKLYIPVLRGMRPLSEDDHYWRRTVQDYFPKTPMSDREIFTGHTIFSEIVDKLLGKQSERLFVKKYEEFLSKNFFDSDDITLIPRGTDNLGEPNDVLYITFEEDEKKERAIHQLGDGLQTIICITYPVFKWVSERGGDKGKKSLIALIEEPEMYLHPSMQRKLVEVLMDPEFEKIQYYITTHSNHFLDLVNEYEYEGQISIFSVTEKGGTRHVRSENDLSDVVYDFLGARPSSLLLANKTIWVEGVTDRIYLRHALKLYEEKNENTAQKKMSENIDFAFIQYGGSNLEHYLKDGPEQADLKIESLSAHRNVFILADDDGTSTKAGSVTKKAKRYYKAKEALGDRFQKTHGREIENYIKPEVLRAVYKDDKKLDGLKHASYKNKNLPAALKEKGVTLYIKSDASTPRFHNKVKFAEKVVECQKSWEDLSKSMQELISNLRVFVLDNTQQEQR